MLQNNLDNLDNVDQKYQAFYTESDNVFVLDSELQQPDINGLKNNNSALKDEKTALRNELQEIKTTLSTLQAQSKEEELLEEKKYSELLTEKENSFKSALDASEATRIALVKDLVNSEVASLAKEIAGDNAALIAPHLAGLEFDNGIVYPDGLDRDSFINKFRDDPLFAPLTKTSKAAGAGASSSQGGSQHTDQGNLEKYFDRGNPNYSPQRQYELQQENPEMYKILEEKFGLNDPYNINKHKIG